MVRAISRIRMGRLAFMSVAFQRSRLFLAAFVCGTVMMAGITTARAQDEASGPVQFDSALTTDFSQNLEGGVRTGGMVMYNVDLTADWNMGHGWEGFGYILIDGHGGFSERYSGDAQVVSNIDAEPGTRLFEAWIRHGGAHTTTTFGMINLNGIFDVQPVGSLFLNASHGIGPDYSQTGPSIFPVSSLGLVQEWRSASGHTQVRAALFDGEAGNPHNGAVFTCLQLSSREGYHVALEAEHDFNDGFVKAGLWGYNRGAERLDGSGPGARNGFYAQAGRTLTHESGDSDQGLAAWLRAGTASDAVYPVQTYVGGGMVYTGPLHGRDHDRIGFAVADARSGAPWRRATPDTARSETNFELSYQAEICGGMMVQPDLQYIRHPSAQTDIKDALVFTLRIKLAPHGCRT